MTRTTRQQRKERARADVLALLRTPQGANLVEDALVYVRDMADGHPDEIGFDGYTTNDLDEAVQVFTTYREQVHG